VRPIAILQPHPAQHKTPKNCEKRTQTGKKKKKPRQNVLSSPLKAPFSLQRHWRFVRARKEEQTTTKRPQKKNRVCYKDTKRGGFRFRNFLEMGITEMRRTRYRMIHRCRSAYENTKKWDQKHTTKTESGEKHDKRSSRRRRRDEEEGATRRGASTGRTGFENV
jgi:hypothetical protein